MFCKRCGKSLDNGRCPRCFENWRGPAQRIGCFAALLLYFYWIVSWGRKLIW